MGWLKMVANFPVVAAVCVLGLVAAFAIGSMALKKAREVNVASADQRQRDGEED
jgi:hypothetical protein